MTKETKLKKEIKELKKDQQDYFEMANRFSIILQDVTNNRMSKPNYTIEAMRECIADTNEESYVLKSKVREALKTLKNFVGNARFKISNKNLKEFYLEVNYFEKELGLTSEEKWTKQNGKESTI